MTPPETKWVRVSRATPCPVCGKFDWCLVAADRTAAICPRTESRKLCGGGYLHRLAETPRPRQDRGMLVRTRREPPDLTALAERYERAATVDQLHTFAEFLGVRTAAMIAFGVGWSADHLAWTFPMTNPVTGTVTGIRLRKPGGGKFSVRGGREALFLPDNVTAGEDVLLITEGATDAIAAHGLGFSRAVGRPSCTGGTVHVIALVRDLNPSRVVLVRDNDEPGVRGAEALARVLALYSRELCVISPPTPHKDLRDWIAAGAIRPDLERTISTADVRRLHIRITTKGAK